MTTQSMQTITVKCIKAADHDQEQTSGQTHKWHHTATQQCLQSVGPTTRQVWQVLKHPEYSLELMPCNLQIFGSMNPSKAKHSYQRLMCRRLWYSGLCRSPVNSLHWDMLT